MPDAQTTVDPQEIAKFSAMAEQWWDETGSFKPLHRFNPIRITYIRDIIGAHFNRSDSAIPLDGLKLVDVGCGGGLLSEPMCRLGAKVTGIDASEKNIGIASVHADQSKLDITYKHSTAEDLAATGEQFDVILAMEIIEHVADVDAFIASIAKLAKPNGLIFVATLNRTLKSFALAIVGAEYIMRWLPIGTHSWDKFLLPSEIEARFASNELSLHERSGFTYNPLTTKWKLSDDLDVNYVVVAKKSL